MKNAFIAVLAYLVIIGMIYVFIMVPLIALSHYGA